jgi:hypothetical protein
LVLDLKRVIINGASFVSQRVLLWQYKDLFCASKQKRPDSFFDQPEFAKPNDLMAFVTKAFPPDRLRIH